VPLIDPAEIGRLALASRRQQGLPDYVEDPAIVARVVALVLVAGETLSAPDDLDAGRVEPITAGDTGVQDHPFGHRANQGATPREASRVIVGLPRRPKGLPAARQTRQGSTNPGG
jgi:hypothetical protein